MRDQRKIKTLACLYSCKNICLVPLSLEDVVLFRQNGISPIAVLVKATTASVLLADLPAMLVCPVTGYTSKSCTLQLMKSQYRQGSDKLYDS